MCFLRLKLVSINAWCDWNGDTYSKNESLLYTRSTKLNRSNKCHIIYFPKLKLFFRKYFLFDRVLFPWIHCINSIMIHSQTRCNRTIEKLPKFTYYLCGFLCLFNKFRNKNIYNKTKMSSHFCYKLPFLARRNQFKMTSVFYSISRCVLHYFIFYFSFCFFGVFKFLFFIVCFGCVDPSRMASSFIWKCCEIIIFDEQKISWLELAFRSLPLFLHVCACSNTAKVRHANYEAEVGKFYCTYIHVRFLYIGKRHIYTLYRLNMHNHSPTYKHIALLFEFVIQCTHTNSQQPSHLCLTLSFNVWSNQTHIHTQIQTNPSNACIWVNHVIVCDCESTTEAIRDSFKTSIQCNFYFPHSNALYKCHLYK